ncbi:MAG: hypothetical protein K2X48_03325 [Chitinophagaceae bacterium]|nr:hypothetical protein [Chitinophagaceae bacterium]
MNNLFRACIIALFLITTSLSSNAENYTTQPQPLLKTKKPKTLIETTYFWGFIPGDRCLHLFAIQDRGYIDFYGRYVSDFYLVQMNVWNYAGTTTICPKDPDEWYV